MKTEYEYLYWENYTPEEIEVACQKIWSQFGEARSKFLIAQLRKDRQEILDRAVTTTNDQSIEDNVKVWQEAAEDVVEDRVEAWKKLVDV